jgi:hypothetical protein
MGSPVTPTLSRYCAMGTGGSAPGVVVVVVVFGVVDQTDW